MPKCRLCASKQLRLVHRRNGYRIVQCERCGFGSTDRLPDKNQLNQLYQVGYHGLIDGSSYEADAAKKFSAIRPYLEPGINLLDYGCGEGYFSNLARNIGCRVWGYDISYAAAKAAQNKFGIPVKTQEARQELFSAGQFDVIAAFDVIEHIVNFKRVLKWWSKWLTPEGYLFITTPDLDSWDAKLLRERWYGFRKAVNYEHVNYFNRRSIREILEQTGFIVEKIQTWGFVRSVDYLLSQLLKIRVSLLPWQIYIPMTDMMVVTRKVSGQLK